MASSIIARITASLLRDLIVPWAISAACIALFLLVVYTFGLLAWPVCFCIFLYLCVQRGRGRRVDTDAGAS